MDQTLNAEPGTLVAQNANSETDKFLTKINDKVRQLKTNGLTRGDQEILRNGRLSFVWGESDANSTIPVTLWRQARARRAYGEIQNANNHLFLAVALAITPTECGKTGFDNVLICIASVESYEPYRLNLDSTAKRFFESLAAEQGFTVDHRYLSFMQSIFPQSLYYTSSKYDGRLISNST